MRAQSQEKLTNRKIFLYGFLSVLSFGLIPSAVKRFEPVKAENDNKSSTMRDFGFAGDIYNSLAYIANATLKVKHEHEGKPKI